MAMLAGCSGSPGTTSYGYSSTYYGTILSSPLAGTQADSGRCANVSSAQAFGGPDHQVPVAFLPDDDGSRLLSYVDYANPQGESEVLGIQVSPDDQAEVARSLPGSRAHSVAPRARTAGGGWFLAGDVGERVTLHAGEPDERIVEGPGVVVLARESPQGELDWVRVLGAQGGASLTGIVALPDDSVIVAYTSDRSPGFGIELPREADRIGVLARIWADGTTAWAQALGGTVELEVTALEAHSLGEAVYVAGSLSGNGTAVFGPDQPSELRVNPAGPEGFVARYDIDGMLDWVTTATGGAANVASIHHAAGRLHVTGTFSGAIMVGAGRPSARSAVATTSTEGWVAQLDEAGEVRWMLPSRGGRTSTGVESHLVVSHGDSVVWIGQYAGGFAVGEGPQLRWIDDKGAGNFLVRLDLDGHLQCATRWWVRASGGLGVVKGSGSFFPLHAVPLPARRLSLWASTRGTVTVDPSGAHPLHHTGGNDLDAMEVVVDLPAL